MIITIFALLFVAEKVFGDMNLLSLKGVQEFAQYTLLVGIIALILSYKPLQYFLISYPDIVFLIVIANLLVGRYMGLQLSEYFRFSPILQDSTEE